MKHLLVSLITMAIVGGCAQAASPLNNVYLRFCDGDTLTKQANINISTAQTGNVCMQFINNSDDDVTVDVGVRDGMLTADAMQNKSCNGEGVENTLDKVITLSEQTITIPAGSSKKLTGTIYFPANTPGGDILACIAYMDSKPKGQTGMQVGNSMFAIKQRVVNLMNISLSGEITLGFRRDVFPVADRKLQTPSISNNPYIYGSLNNNTLLIKTQFSNTGSVNELVSITGTATTIRGETRTIYTQKIVPTKGSTIVELSLTGTHRYDGLYNISIVASHKPIINAINHKEYKTEYLTQTTTLWVLPVLEIIVGLLIICIILLIILTRQHKQRNKKPKSPYASKRFVPTEEEISPIESHTLSSSTTSTKKSEQRSGKRSETETKNNIKTMPKTSRIQTKTIEHGKKDGESQKTTKKSTSATTTSSSKNKSTTKSNNNIKKETKKDKK